MKEKRDYSLKKVVGELPYHVRPILGAILSISSLGGGHINLTPPIRSDDATVSYGVPRDERGIGQQVVIIGVSNDNIIAPIKDTESVNAPEITTQNDLPRILDKVKENESLSFIFGRGLTQQNLIDDLTIYYPIFKAVGDAYDLPWELLYTIAAKETTVSRDLGDGSTYAGIEQRQISEYSDEYAEEALSMMKLEYLKDIPNVRHPEDAREIAAMARIIIDKMKETDGTILGALYSYGPDAKLRLDIVYQLKEALK